MRARGFVGAAGGLGARALLGAALVAGLALATPAMAQAAAKPGIGPLWSTEVAATSVRLHAEVNPEGSETTYHFNYITEAAYQANLGGGKEGFAGAAKAPGGTDPSIGSGEAPKSAQQLVGALTPETTYRYRVVAHNAEGTEASSAYAFTTQSLGGAALLLDNRGWEMVSPIDKNGGQIEGPGQNAGGDVLQAAASGEAVTYSSLTSFGAGAQGAPPASQYLSSRSAAGWSTANISVPLLAGSYGDHPNGVPYQLFSTDLARALLLDPTCEGESCSYSLRESESGALTPLPEAAAGMRLASASPDLHRLVFESEGSFYEWSGAGLVPIGPPPPPSPGVLGESADGSVVYYQDGAGLFVSREGAVTEIAPGAEAAQPSDYPPGAGTARVSADGSHLAFLSKARLTGYDNTDQLTGEPDSEVFLYSAGSGGGSLTCVSCNPTNERPLGPSTIPGAIANGTAPGSTQIYKPRNLSANANRLFFDSRDALTLRDTDNAPDVYEWEAQGEGSCASPGGCLGPISSGRSAEGASFADASADGSDAFFLTDGSLVPSDPGSVDLYDARVGGGFPVAPTPIECQGDACQSLPPEPEDPEPGTLRSGPGNPPAHFPKAHKQRRHHKKKPHRKRSHRHSRRAS